MQSRMDRYNSSEQLEKTITSKFEINKGTSRQARNQKLYENYGDTQLDNFDVDNNVSVIGNNSKNIDIDSLRDMLDKKYREPVPKKKENDYDEDQVAMRLAETREYDLSQILEKARANKELDYEKDRLMKLHNTQYDILKNLNLYGENETEESEDENENVVNVSRPRSENEKRLLDLIDTINENEFRNTQELALDIFSDLTGDDDNTRVMGAMDMENIDGEELEIDKNMNTTQILEMARNSIEQKKEETSRFDTKDFGSTTQVLVEAGKVINEIGNQPHKEIIKENNEVTEEMGSTTQILMEAGKVIDQIDNQKNNLEFPMTKEQKIQETTSISKINEQKNKPKSKKTIDDDFADIKEDSFIINFLIKIIIVIIIILFVAGAIYLANRFLNLGLF